MSLINSIVQTKEFAALPTITTKILELLEKDDIGVQNIVRVIETDPSLTLKLIRIANSPLYGAKSEINSVYHATMLIGFSKLTNIVLGVSIFSKFWLSQKKGIKELMDKFWLHCVSTGTVAKSIAGKLGVSFNENEFIGGLLYQIGKLAIIQHSPEKYAKVIELVSKEGKTDFVAENEVFGVTHLEVGAQIASLWKLPEELQAVISEYQFPYKLDKHRQLAAVVGLAGMICETHGTDFYKGLLPTSLEETAHWSVLLESNPSMQGQTIDLFTQGIDEELAKSTDFFNTLKT
jgi:HD-like signal output (HDOD) protein